MKKHLFILLIGCMMLSCAKTKQAEESKSEENQPAEAQTSLFTSEAVRGKLLLLSDKLTVYDNNGKESGKTNGLFGLIVDMDSISKDRVDVSKSGDNCNAFHFVKANGPKVNGWLYNKDVFGYGNNERDTIFSAGGVTFKLYVAKNFGLGASDDDGLTGCEDISPVVLSNSKSNAEAFVPLTDTTGKYPGKFLTLDGHDGWYDTIKETAFENGKLKLTLQREYQEGSADFTIFISFNSNGYSAEVMAVKEY